MWFCRVMLDYAFLLDPKKDACKCALGFTDNFFQNIVINIFFIKSNVKPRLFVFLAPSDRMTVPKYVLTKSCLSA